MQTQFTILSPERVTYSYFFDDMIFGTTSMVYTPGIYSIRIDISVTADRFKDGIQLLDSFEIGGRTLPEFMDEFKFALLVGTDQEDREFASSLPDHWKVFDGGGDSTPTGFAKLVHAILSTAIGDGADIAVSITKHKGQ